MILSRVLSGSWIMHDLAYLLISLGFEMAILGSKIRIPE